MRIGRLFQIRSEQQKLKLKLKLELKGKFCQMLQLDHLCRCSDAKTTAFFLPVFPFSSLLLCPTLACSFETAPTHLASRRGRLPIDPVASQKGRAAARRAIDLPLASHHRDTRRERREGVFARHSRLSASALLLVRRLTPARRLVYVPSSASHWQRPFARGRGRTSSWTRWMTPRR